MQKHQVRIELNFLSKLRYISKKARAVDQGCPGKSEYLPSPSLLYIINALGHRPRLQSLVEQSPDPNLTPLF